MKLDLDTLDLPTDNLSDLESFGHGPQNLFSKFSDISIFLNLYISAFSKYTKILQALYSMWHFTWISTYGEATSLCSMNAMFCSSWALYQKLGHREEIPVAEIYTRLCHVLLYGLEYWKGWDFSSSSSTGSVGGLWYLEDKQTHGLFPFLTIK